MKDSDSPTNTIMKVGIVLDKTKGEPKIVFLSKERSLIDVLSNTLGVFNDSLVDDFPPFCHATIIEKVNGDQLVFFE